jgi:hypothetical protein
MPPANHIKWRLLSTQLLLQQQQQTQPLDALMPLSALHK